MTNVERHNPSFVVSTSKEGFVPSSTRTNIEDYASLDAFDAVPAELREIAVDVAVGIVDATDEEVSIRYGIIGQRALVDPFTMDDSAANLEFVRSLHESLADPQKEKRHPEIKKALRIELATLEASSKFAHVLGYNPAVHTYKEFVRNPDFQNAQMLLRGAVGTFVAPQPMVRRSGHGTA